jgi:hypothetical protein
MKKNRGFDNPKSGASANFATLANRFSTLDFRFAIARKPFIVFAS